MTVTEAHVAPLRRRHRDDPPGVPALAPELLGLCLSTGLGWRIDRARRWSCSRS